MLKSFSAAGILIENELVRCNESVSINGNTYYRGYLCNTINANIFGNTSATYGAWDATGKTGIRQFVQLGAYPIAAGTISIDTRYGHVYSAVADDFYIYYLAHEPIKHNDCLIMTYPFLLKAGTAYTIYQTTFQSFAKFAYVDIFTSGGLPTQSVTFTLSNGTESQNITCTAATLNHVEFTAPLKINCGETLTLSTANGYGMFGFKIRLSDVL